MTSHTLAVATGRHLPTLYPPVRVTGCFVGNQDGGAPDAQGTYDSSARTLAPLSLQPFCPWPTIPYLRSRLYVSTPSSRGSPSPTRSHIHLHRTLPAALPPASPPCLAWPFYLILSYHLGRWYLGVSRHSSTPAALHSPRLIFDSWTRACLPIPTRPRCPGPCWPPPVLPCPALDCCGA